jgi:transcriptional regulator with XRE-family HTH domain
MNERTIGQNIRRLRETTGQTLTDMARAANITKSTLSKIENGQVSSPISTLIRIADALNQRIDQFFVETEGESIYVLTGKGKGRLVTRDGSRFGYTYEALAAGFPHKLAEPFILTTQPGDRPKPFTHDGQEFIHMLAGRMRFFIAGKSFLIGPGDSLYFDSRYEHYSWVVGKRPARFLCVFLQVPREGARIGRTRAESMTKTRAMKKERKR